MIGFIGAMQLELDGIRAKMENKSSVTVSGVEYVTGTLCGTEIVTAVCGIGKVFAAICTQTMILKFSPDVIINTGIAGSLSNQLSIGDVVVADRVLQHDMDTSPLGDPVGLISGINKIYFETDGDVSDKLSKCLSEVGVRHIRGTVATGDQFISSSEKKDHLVKSFSAVACEMESGSVGHVCAVNGVPFAILRAISDSADENATVDYPTFARAAAEKYVAVVCKFAERA